MKSVNIVFISFCYSYSYYLVLFYFFYIILLQVGTVEPLVSEISVTSNVQLYNGKNPSSITTRCAEPCLECLYMFNHLEYLYVRGDVLVGVVFNVHYAGDGPYTCGDFRLHNGALNTEIMKMVVETFPNTGIIGFDGCSNPTRALAGISRLMTSSMTIGTNTISPEDILLWVTYDSATTREAATYLQKLGIPLFSPSAAAPSLADLTTYTTLVRTLPNDAFVAEAMAKFIDMMGWRYVLIVNAPDFSSRETVKLFVEYLENLGICAVAQYEFETDGAMEVIWGSLLEYETDIVAVFSEPDQYISEFLKVKEVQKFGPSIRFIANRQWGPDFQARNNDLKNSVFFRTTFESAMENLWTDSLQNYLESQDVLYSTNPWFSSLYEETFDCNLPGSFHKKGDCTSPYNR